MYRWHTGVTVNYFRLGHSIHSCVLLSSSRQISWVKQMNTGTLGIMASVFYYLELSHAIQALRTDYHNFYFCNCMFSYYTDTQSWSWVINRASATGTSEEYKYSFLSKQNCAILFNVYLFSMYSLFGSFWLTRESISKTRAIIIFLLPESVTVGIAVNGLKKKKHWNLIFQTYSTLEAALKFNRYFVEFIPFMQYRFHFTLTTRSNYPRHLPF